MTRFSSFRCVSWCGWLGCIFGVVGESGLLQAEPLKLHPDNAHYFLYQGRPTIVITSGEHYGAVLNLDFDYAKYLETLAKDGLNGTRTWSGAYCEPTAAFSIAQNTLAPAAGRFITPWARSTEAGYKNGGNKFDLTQWDESYFKRLKDFMAQASRRGIIVELNLFCPFYEESMWELSPMNAANNINNVGNVARTNVYTLDQHGGLLAIQEGMVRKLVRELNRFDNLYFEICNEPYFGGVTLEWQHHIADVITATEKELGNRHLISQNIANGHAKVEQPHPAVSIFNFHYAAPPNAVPDNFHLNKVIGENETGFLGTNDAPYRMEAWDFLVAGGGLFNNLDYSFTVGHEDGTFSFPASQPGCGSVAFRKQLASLRHFINGFDFIHMRPSPELLGKSLPANLSARALSKSNEASIVYLRTEFPKPNEKEKSPLRFSAAEVTLELNLSQGAYAFEWFDTKQGQVVKRDSLTHPGGVLKLIAPAFEQDIALRVLRDDKRPRPPARPTGVSVRPN